MMTRQQARVRLAELQERLEGPCTLTEIRDAARAACNLVELLEGCRLSQWLDDDEAEEEC